MIRKPGSVLANHLSRLAIAHKLERFNQHASAGNLIETHFLATYWVYLSRVSPHGTVGSYPTRFIVAPHLLDLSLRLALKGAGLFRFCGTFPKITLGCR